MEREKLRPELTKELSISKFDEYYWLKAELQDFCREIGISASGSKEELTESIALYLETGQINKPSRKKNAPSKKVTSDELSLDTMITENHRCSQVARAFFESVIPNFHFSTYIQNYFKSHVGKTYRDVVDAWYEEEERKKDPSYQTEIGSQFEYNQFFRDYFADPNNNSKNREDAIKAWYAIKVLPGSNKYTG